MFVCLCVFLSFFMTQLMMFSHRWSHMRNSDKPFLAHFLQKTGIIMSDAHHHKHHTTYDCNFAIFSGLCNPILNHVVKIGWHQDDMKWLGPLLIGGLTPTIGALLGL